jgi:hypothetical protein
LPLLSAVTVALAAPLNVTVAPLPPAAGEIMPDIDPVCTAAAKFKPVALDPFSVKDKLDGVNVTPVLLGVSV